MLSWRRATDIVAGDTLVLMFGMRRLEKWLAYQVYSDGARHSKFWLAKIRFEEEDLACEPEQRVDEVSATSGLADAFGAHNQHGERRRRHRALPPEALNMLLDAAPGKWLAQSWPGLVREKRRGEVCRPASRDLRGGARVAEAQHDRPTEALQQCGHVLLLLLRSVMLLPPLHGTQARQGSPVRRDDATVRQGRSQNGSTDFDVSADDANIKLECNAYLLAEPKRQ
mmetsp:Transcript_45062/g.119534  ORF Transcript_45062/g.119534 Transcript_45062/m.119534 type:complete len:226 (-) Transcript_45062:132-809(-)